jgi:hypothetical protein
VALKVPAGPHLEIDSSSCEREKPGRQVLVDETEKTELEETLTLMPRTVRDKLDRVAVKVHLKEWQALSVEERTLLRDTACENEEEVHRYAVLVDELVKRRTGRIPDRLPVTGPPPRERA